jgi:hypothetical protein
MDTTKERGLTDALPSHDALANEMGLVLSEMVLVLVI